MDILKKILPTTASQKPRAESLPKPGQWPSFQAETGSKKGGDINFQKIFRIFYCSLCNFPIVALDNWDHFSPSLESTGVLSYKFSNALEMSFHLVHSHFSVLNRWADIRILVKIFEARLRYRSFSRIFACKIFSAGLSILIMKTSRNSQCWVKWAFRLSLGCSYRRSSFFIILEFCASW